MPENKSRGGGEKHTRTVFKAISWRIIATLTTMAAVYLFTREPMISLGVGAVEVIAKVTFYYFHERIWNKISWGKDKHPLSVLPIKGEIRADDMEKIKAHLRELGYLD
ncbi:MAG: DUF2061 domain-containing protein [Candidatus Aminicenantes bacterium]|nr:DUF2061 domain-containing protein [Candidatus Aminicenantes bacterium]